MSERIRPIICTWRLVDVSNPATGEVREEFAMVPIDRHRNIANAQYAPNEEYPLLPFQARSQKSHGYYFAALRAAFDNLPEGIAKRWPTVDHFRKWLLIETEWFDEKEWTFEGRDAEAKARKLGAFIRTEDEYARIATTMVDGEPSSREKALDLAVEAFDKNADADHRERIRLTVRAALAELDKGGKWKVIVRRAKSQDHASMDKDSFQKSSKAVLELASEFTKTSVPALIKEGKRHHG